MGILEDLARARDAYERREWVTAYDALSALDGATLNPSDFGRLATVAYLLGRKNDCVQALQRAYQVHVSAGQHLDASRAAFWLAHVLISTGEPAIGSGWIGRCQRHLGEVEDDVVERGYVLILEMMRHAFSGEFQQAAPLAEQITEYGRRFGDPDLLAEGLMAHGRMAMYSGHVPQGLALFDEAMVGISLGEVSPIIAGAVYCSLIEACQEVSDYGRVVAWTQALTSWIDAQPGLVMFTGQCALHRGQIMRFRGAFREAIEEYQRAQVRYAAAGTPWAAGLALAEIGDVHTICGDFAAAEAAYEQAAALGHEPQPGLSQLWLARGRANSATTAVRRVLAEPRDPVHRSQILPGAIAVLLAGGSVDEAAALTEELAAIASAFSVPTLKAHAHQSRAAVLLAGNAAAEALHEARQAMALWRSLEARYDAARCSVIVGRALRALDDVDSAADELRQAQRTFAELGAVADADLVASPDHDRPGGLTTREVEVLRLVASGKSNQQIAAELTLSEKTVGRHLSNIFAKLEVTSRTAAAAFAFERGLL